MAKDLILAPSCLNLCLFFVNTILCLLRHCSGETVEAAGGVGAPPYNSFTVSSFTYSTTVLKPYEWRYIRVDLPPWFSSVSVALHSDVDIDLKSIKRLPESSTLPMICFREGSPPLPDVYNTSMTGLVLEPLSNGSFGGIQDFQIAERCYPMQKDISLKLTNEQISPGVWYFGLFNGVGSMRTQSKMINRGSAYSFNGNVSVEGCTAPILSGQYCNQTVDPLSCVGGYNLTENRTDINLYNQSAETIVSCKNTDEASCHDDGKPKVFSLDVVGISVKLAIRTKNVRFNATESTNDTSKSSGTLMCYARLGAMPLPTLHDYSGNINEAPLIILSPKVGRWYISIQPLNPSNDIGTMQAKIAKICYSLEWETFQCPTAKAGLNCSCEKYMLQTVLRKNPSVPFESYYAPVSERMSSDSANFPLEPLLSNSSYEGSLNTSWTYFLLDIPAGAVGGNIHIRIMSDAKINYEVYARYGGLPSLDSFDYFYTNTTSNSNGSMFFKLYDSSEKSISFYILYARGGIWSFGLRNPDDAINTLTRQTTMSISLERCPRRCSSHGTCQSVLDASGLTLYSFCFCDRNHGGFDCSVEIVSHRGHIWQSVSLIASNAAAAFPAYWALRQKAFAEWVLFTSSGISSGLYHACDVGTWCALTFHVLQFMDFWLSFMAVVSTFVYIAAIDEASKRTIHTVVAIVTALMAETGPTRSTNIILVIAIGALGLLIAWMIEFCTKYRWQTIKGWVYNIIHAILRRFCWGFVLAGFIALAMAAISWRLETSENYWIWHSVWHVSIYTSSFLFLCSKVNNASSENLPPPPGSYELTRQDSIPRVENGSERERARVAEQGREIRWCL